MTRSTPRRQSHAVVNRNARNAASRADPSNNPLVNVSTPLGGEHSVFELDGRLTLVQERDIEWRVPVQISERPAPDIECINNPINQLGALHSACVPIVTSNDPVSYASAVNKRSNFVQSGKDDDVSDESYEEALSIIKQMPKLFPAWEENDADREKWLAKFDAPKQARMREAWANVSESELHEIRKKTGSVKIETLMKRFDTSAAGRIIYAGSDVFNAITGPAQMVAMERLVELLAHTHPDGSPVTVGDVEVKLGYKSDSLELASYIVDDRYTEVVEGDFSRNDREQRSRVAKITDAWFELLNFPAWYRELLFDLERYTLTNFDFGLRVDLLYQLATGTTNTTFRNSTYNITMFAVACKRQRRRGKALVLGDDILACLNKRFNLDQWTRDVASFKMVLKAKAPRLDGEATFLSRRFFANVETPFMVPLIGKMLVRFNARANQNSAISDSTAMAAKALSYAYGCQNIHCLRDIFLERYEMEDDKAEVSVADLGWQVRSLGYTTEDIKRRCLDAPNLVLDDEFSEWLTDVYDIDIVDCLELFRETILCVDPVILEDPRIEKFAKDYE